MIKIIIFSLIFTFGLISCGDDSTGADKDAPEIKKIVPDTLSITGKLSITFNEKIDTETVVFEMVKGSFNSSFKSATEVIFSGDTSSSGIEHFKLSKKLKLNIRNLTDMEGNSRGDAVTVDVPFFYWADLDAKDPDFGFADTLRDTQELSQWKNGADLNIPLTSEGRLFPKQGDNFDYKIIALTLLDTVSITLECPEENLMGFTFYGPFNPKGFEKNYTLDNEQIDTDHDLFINQKLCTDKKNIITLNNHVMDASHHLQTINTANELFYIVEIFTVTNQDWGFYKLHTAISPRKK